MRQRCCSVLLNVTGSQQAARSQQERSKAASTAGVHVQQGRPVARQESGVAEVVGHHDGGVQGGKVKGGHGLPVVPLLGIQHCGPFIPHSIPAWCTNLSPFTPHVCLYHQSEIAV